MSLTPLLTLPTFEAVVWLLIYLVVGALVFYLVAWLIGWIGIPEPFNKIIKAIVGLLVVIFLLYLLFGIAGRPGFG